MGKLETSVVGATECGTTHSSKPLEDPDADFVASAQDGDLEAFEELVRRHSRLIYRVLVAILGDRDEAEDAMQETFLSAFKYIGGFQWRSKFSTWLVSIARNAALQRLRRQKDTESLDTVELGDDCYSAPRQVRTWQDNPEQAYSRAEIQHIVERGILQLSTKYRVVVVLRDVQQLSGLEAARQLGLTVSTVKTRLLRGRLMLRDLLMPYFSKNA
ncbi:MAG TPA: sigma-70 family RNA polymerase sigma factor [Candidatus Acidoferrales bacterium]|nr:sigma-70 family RNA polymerase sigma factor [Candidatus Acidoferrales bacterium]